MIEKNMKKNICITESICCTAEIKPNIVNQICFNKKKKQQQQPRSGPASTCSCQVAEDKKGQGASPSPLCDQVYKSICSSSSTHKQTGYICTKSSPGLPWWSSG